MLLLRALYETKVEDNPTEQYLCLSTGEMHPSPEDGGPFPRWPLKCRLHAYIQWTEKAVGANFKSFVTTMNQNHLWHQLEREKQKEHLMVIRKI